MRRRPSAQSLKSDSIAEDLHDEGDGASSIFMALAASSGNSSDAEKDSVIDTPESSEQERRDEEVTESTSLLYKHRRANTYDGVAVKDKAEIWANGQSVPNVVYASPARPHLPSPLTPNSRVGGVASASTGGYLPHNWRTPAMVPYDVQAHPFNRAPSASPQMTVARNRYSLPSDTDVTGGSSRSSIWSVEIEQGSCGCLSGIWQACFGKKTERSDTPSDGY